MIDNCCKLSHRFSHIFPNILVKLDLFHATQRFVKTLAMEVRLKTDICKGYGLVFRQPCDLGVTRLKATPDTQTLLRNLESFERKWCLKMWKGASILNPAAKKAITNIKLHIGKGCLSGIPVGVSTSGNERLHRHLNNALKTNKLGLETAYVRCSRLFFKINNNGHGTKSTDCHSATAWPKGKTDFSIRKEHFGFDNFKYIDGELEVSVPEKCTVICKSLDDLTKDVLSNIKSTIAESLKFSNGDEVQHDHGYTERSDKENNAPLSVAYSGLTFYEMFKGLSDLGATRLLLKPNTPLVYSIKTLWVH